VDDIVLEFLKRDQSLGALREAAYRLIGDASCKIESSEDGFICRLTPPAKGRLSVDELRGRFLDLVTDENLREKIAAQTEPTRNLLLALAFGALAEARDQSAP
jgi:His-Xaa-Ser system protein HxsD